ncbi:MAG TPA: hypothetical protein VGA56_23830 [Opitutaceae bacterium]
MHMLIGVILVAALVWSIGAILTVIHIRCAPEGYEDETGFHMADASKSMHRTIEPRLIEGIAEDFG